MTREEKVAVFNRIMGQPVADNHKEVPLKLRQLGIKLIFEELKELAIASGCEKTYFDLCVDSMNESVVKSVFHDAPTEQTQEYIAEHKAIKEVVGEHISDSDIIDEVEQIDGLADVQYTLSWAVNVFGHSSRFIKAFDEACESNNSKACKTKDEAIETVTYWENKDGVPCHIEEIDGLFVVKNSFGKVKKSVNYIPTNYKLLFNHG